jgi:hypothetical protein
MAETTTPTPPVYALVEYASENLTIGMVGTLEACIGRGVAILEQVIF